MIDYLYEMLISKVESVKQGKYTSIILDIDPLDIKSFLRLHSLPIFFYESEEEEFVAIGEVRRISVNGTDRFAMTDQLISEFISDLQIHNYTDHPINPRFVGGFSFTPRKPTSYWNSFATSLMIMPELLLYRSGSTFAACFTFEDRTELDSLFNVIQSFTWDSTDMSANKLESVSYPLDQETWISITNEAQNLMEVGNLQKVVLSRVSELRTQDRLNAIAIMTNLHRSYPRCFKFYFKPNGPSFFFGASPELLCESEDGVIRTMALAGTTPRSNNPVIDQKLAQELLNNEKERYEHQVVVDELVTQLQQITDGIEVDHTPVILKLANVQHLKTNISALLPEQISMLDLVELLHPTPALGGKPRLEALKFIEEIEPVSRGMYASPLGWLDTAGNGQFCVAIRSAISDGQVTCLYAGAGIVKQSDPIREWDEIELKFKPILEALKVIL